MLVGITSVQLILIAVVAHDFTDACVRNTPALSDPLKVASDNHRIARFMGADRHRIATPIQHRSYRLAPSVDIYLESHFSIHVVFVPFQSVDGAEQCDIRLRFLGT